VIRLLKKEELPRFHKLGAWFFEAAKRPGKYNPEAFERLWNSLFDAGLALFLIAEQNDEVVGAFGAVVHEDYISGQKTASEMFWVVFPEARGTIGLRLFNEFEAEAKKRGAERIMMIHLNHLTPDSLQKFYERRGYRSIEQTFEKVLK
jgi:GNAT superfamily N-acetyltransferase